MTHSIHCKKCGAFVSTKGALDAVYCKKCGEKNWVKEETL